MFSKACEYGIRAMTYIAQESDSDRRIGLKEIAKAVDSPEAFTAKVLQQLSRGGLVDSTKGPNGGFRLNAEQQRTVMLSDIVRTIDGDKIYTGCGLGLSYCDAQNPCPLHDDFLVVRKRLRMMLETTSIKQLSKNLEKGMAILKR